ncbi:Tma64p Ecym_4301 [Eremothecium cymbalariae DBVPG|uniref:SUI1 domain-containing protein n=1 Tax=Eremothecium cymbalariae (strain CBS 270.75 / DBVPG 7215 / KCTC 17166 / NRRL Y-17582) TaxID=931890 RepID=G8JTL1_ERECY|nr:hypothetical protein Ecym_4301 [Eremothecium cymbalariae DBVPG\
MFKKKPTIKSASNLKNSERKKLLGNVRAQCANQEFQFSTTIVKQATFKTPTATGTIFTDEDNKPIFFKEKHSEFLIPTILTCWQYPGLLHVVLTHKHVLDNKLKNGADLMLPGTIPPFSDNCTRGKLVGVASSETPFVVEAIGVCQLNLAGIVKVVGETGVAVKVLHTINDGLWEVFKMSVEPPSQLLVSQKHEVELEALAQADDAGGIQEDEDLPTAKTASGPLEEPNSLSEVAEQLEELSIETVDHFLTQAVYYTLALDNTLKLPIGASNFIANHVMKNLPRIHKTQVSLKRSSWARASKFLKYFENQGFLKLKGKVENLTVVSVNKDKTEIKSFQPYRTIQKSVSTSSKNNDKHDVEVVVYYQPLNTAKATLHALGNNPNAMLKAKDIKAILNKYVTEKKLVNATDERIILLDDTLFSLAYKKSASDSTRKVLRAKMFDLILSTSFTEVFFIFKDGKPLSSKPLKSKNRNVSVMTEMKIHRKIVTRISNFEIYGVDPEELSLELRKRCSGSSTVLEPSTLQSTTEVQVQGPHGNTAINILNEHGIPSKYIDFDNKLNKKKK